MSAVSQRKQRRHKWWNRKRQQENQNDGSENEQSIKKRKKSEVQENEEENISAEKNSNPCSRFILFIGNLPFECTESDIRNHFDSDGGITDKALQRHNSTMCGRRINVEVTCGGGGKGEQRMTKLRSKIDKMKEKRKKAKLKKKQRSIGTRNDK
ncbi:nucleolar protein 6-like isoform X2 [Dendronephthya gigantea]|uniref:nucleolar protein 6-like isoform X2 n=1 Tax=Dendronephthya gigantea TaxID=151771 RepID=UPI00106BD82E|nr:nucleolar protein 6-like isoform X2 [Dendronephthya gigantea]